MSTILFDKIVFGPVKSRRLGVSLGMNLLPPDGKFCSFDCIYCECGLNEERKTTTRLPTREEARKQLEETLLRMQADGMAPDVITFAGNGEPTMHPQFAGIIDDTVALRDQYFPKAKIAVLSNATMIKRKSVFDALMKIDDRILKLDSVLDSRIQQLNAPYSPSFTYKWLVENLKPFAGNLIIQTMFLNGTYKGESVTNMTEEEISGWINALKEINPRQVMIYTVERETPVKGLRKATKEELDAIADRAREAGFEVSVSY